MTDLLTRLKDWENVYPCDMDKPDGNLYGEAYEALSKAIAKLEAIKLWVDGLSYYTDPSYKPAPVFRDLPELIKELKS